MPRDWSLRLGGLPLGIRAMAVTPVMRQHAAAKQSHPDAIVFFRLGDFYEMFGDDAVLVARVLDLTLTSRNKGKLDEIPMAGVPHHAAHGYVTRLLRMGHKVAICEQMADPTKTKGIVPRQVVRVITPGLATHGEHLEASKNNWLIALEIGAGEVAMALLDLSTAELSVAQFPDLTGALAELSHAGPHELLLDSVDVDGTQAPILAVLPRVAIRRDEPMEAIEAKCLHEALELDTTGISELGARAAARALRFAQTCNPQVKLPVRRIGCWEPSGTLQLDVTGTGSSRISEI